MAEIILFHHVQGLTPGVAAFADELRRAGHTVHTPDKASSRRGQGKQFPDRAAGASSGPQLQDLTEKHQRDDDRCSLEINLGVPVDFELVR